MKAKLLRESGFEPIKIEITIESEEELCDLAHRYCLGASKVNELSKIGLIYGANNDITEFYDLINLLIDKHKLKN